MKKERIIRSISEIGDLSNMYLKNSRKRDDEELEKFFCKFEQIRLDLYEGLRNENRFREFGAGEPIDNLIYDYKVEFKNNVLKIYIPERIPKINKGINYVQKQIMLNVARVVEKYKGIFYNKPIMVVIKIYDNIRIWDVDNRNIKPIHDGLIYGKVIKDDNIYCSSYMVQGYYSERPYAEVYILESDKIIRKIDKKIIKKNIKIWQNFKEKFEKFFAIFIFNIKGFK